MYFDRNWGIKRQNPEVDTVTYLRENHKFRVWEWRNSISLHFFLDRTCWDKYMLNGMTVGRFEDMSDLVRSRGKMTEQCTHFALVQNTFVCFHRSSLPLFYLHSVQCQCFVRKPKMILFTKSNFLPQFFNNISPTPIISRHLFLKFVDYKGQWG